MVLRFSCVDNPAWLLYILGVRGEEERFMQSTIPQTSRVPSYDLLTHPFASRFDACLYGLRPWD